MRSEGSGAVLDLVVVVVVVVGGWGFYSGPRGGPWPMSINRAGGSSS